MNKYNKEKLERAIQTIVDTVGEIERNNTTLPNLLDNMDIEQLYVLKDLFKAVNSSFTKKVEKLLIDRLATLFGWNADEKSKIKTGKAGANGYDLVHHVGDISIVCEVKSNKPVYENSFGSQQQKGIEQYLKNLCQVKNKKNDNLTQEDLDRSYKFFGQYDSGDGKVETAMKTLVKNLKEFGRPIVFLGKNWTFSKLNTSTIYIVILGPN